MGLLKDAIMNALKSEGVEAQWMGNEPPRRIKSAAQSKYDDLRAVERNYVRGVNKARKEHDHEK